MSSSEKRQEIADHRSKVGNSLKELLAGTEALLKSTASYTGEELDTVRGKLKVRLEAARESAGEWESVAREKYERAAAVTDTYVHENAWKSIGLAAVAGLLIGHLLQSNPKRDRD